jgi:hypothetical protein
MELAPPRTGAVAAGLDLRAKHAAAGRAMAAATLAMAAAAALQAVLYLAVVGVGTDTDGFFAAFAVYTILGVFGQSLRVTAVPLLVDGRMGARRLACALVLLGGVVLVACVPLAGATAALLAPGLPAAGRDVTAAALPLLGLAAALQLLAAGAAAVLAVGDDLLRVAAAYATGAAAGLVAFVALLAPTDELALGWSMLAMAIVTLAVLAAGLRPVLPRRTDVAGAGRAAAQLLGRTGIYLAFHGLLLVTLAVAGSVSDVGTTTTLSYAYLCASYLVAGTAAALGTARVADMARGAAGAWRARLVRDTVPQGLRYAWMLVAPALALVVVAGAGGMHAVVPSSLSAADAGDLARFTALLAPWTVAALLVSLLLPALLALGRARALACAAPLLVAGHLAATLAGGALGGAGGVALASCAAPLALAAWMLAAGAPDDAPLVRRVMARDVARFAVLAAAAFGAGAAAGALAGGGLAGALAAGAAGTLLYAAAVRLVAPREAHVLLHGPIEERA